MTKIVGIGAGGHASVVIDILHKMGGHEIVGLVDANSQLWQTNVMGIPVLGDDSCLDELLTQGVTHAFIGVGSSDDMRQHTAVYDKACEAGFNIIDAVHPSAVIADSARTGNATTIMANAVINPRASLGNDVIINTGAIVEHHCQIGDHVHVATGARLAGSVRVEDGVHIGIGATIRQGISIGSGSVIGAGSVVLKNVPPNTVVVGVPARFLREVRA